MLLLAGCAASIVQRIEKNPAIFNSLSDSQKALVQQGRIEEGMGKDAVWLAWGPADRTATGTHAGLLYERWSYTGYEPVYGAPFSFGGGYWGGRPYIGAGYFNDPYFFPAPMMNFVPYEARRVEFKGGKVSGWMAAR